MVVLAPDLKKTKKLELELGEARVVRVRSAGIVVVGVLLGRARGGAVPSGASVWCLWCLRRVAAYVLCVGVLGVASVCLVACRCRCSCSLSCLACLSRLGLCFGLVLSGFAPEFPWISELPDFWEEFKKSISL